MIERQKNAYITPLLTVVEFRTERGYAESSYTWTTPAEQINMFVSAELEMVDQNDGTDGNLAAGYLGGQEDHSNAANGSSWSYANGSWF